MSNVVSILRNRKDTRQELIDFIKDEDFSKFFVIGFNDDDPGVWGTSQYGGVNNSDIAWYATKLLYKVHEG